MTDDLRYPIGTYTAPEEIEASRRAVWIDDIAHAPAALRAAVSGLSPEQLDTPYRSGGWTARQLAHHMPDSHLNAYLRFKLALTEHEPTIKPYDQASWVELPDTARTPVEVSLRLLESLHERWVTLLRAMTDADFRRGYRHPELGRIVPLGEALGAYAWHGKHHVAHVTGLRQRHGW